MQRDAWTLSMMFCRVDTFVFAGWDVWSGRLVSWSVDGCSLIRVRVCVDASRQGCGKKHIILFVRAFHVT